MDKVTDAELLNETKEKQRFQVGHTLPTCPQTPLHEHTEHGSGGGSSSEPHTNTSGNSET